MGMIDILKTELTSDPLAVGYSGMSDAAAADSLNDSGAGRTLAVDRLDAVDLYEAIDTAEFDALTASEKQAVDRILGLGGDVLVSVASKARAVLLAAFGAGSASRTAIAAEVQQSVSRAGELGLSIVRVGHIQEARR